MLFDLWNIVYKYAFKLEIKTQKTQVKWPQGKKKSSVETAQNKKCNVTRRSWRYSINSIDLTILPVENSRCCLIFIVVNFKKNYHYDVVFIAIYRFYQIQYMKHLRNKRGQRSLGRSPNEKVRGYSEAIYRGSLMLYTKYQGLVNFDKHFNKSMQKTWLPGRNLF